MDKEIILIDMDEVIVDFYSHPTLKIPKDEYNHPNMFEEGYFRNLKPLPGAIKAVRKLINSNEYDVYIATKPVAELPYSYSDKVRWIKEYLPELESKIILAQVKGMLKGDYLIDDTPENAKGFDGEFIHFDRSIFSVKMWNIILGDLL